MSEDKEKRGEKLDPSSVSSIMDANMARTILEKSPDIILCMDKNAKITYINYTIPGLTPEQVIGTSAYNYVPKEHHTTLKKALETCLATGEDQHYETKGTGHNNTLSWYRAKMSALKKEGTIIGAVIMTRDITKERTDAEALRQSESRYRKLFENKAHAAMIFDRETLQFEEVNAAALSLFKYASEEFLNLTVIELSAEPEKTKETLTTLPPNEHHHIPERLFKRKDRTTFVGQIHASELLLNGRKKIFAVVQDITESKKAARQLEETKTFLHSVFENIPDMIFVKDAKELRFVNFNKAGEELIGLSRDELIGKNDYDFFPKAQADFFTEKDRQVLSGKTVVDIPEEPIHTAHKGTRHLHTKKVPLFDPEGNPKYLLGISEDITELKKIREERQELQEQLRLRAKKLESKVKKLEKDHIPLNENEKLVFTALVHYPQHNDQQISAITKLKRSTVTAIRNRLKKDKWFKRAVLPNFAAIGYDALYFFYNDTPKSYNSDHVSKGLQVIKDSKHAIFSQVSEKFFFTMSVYQNRTHAHEKIHQALTLPDTKEFMKTMKYTHYILSTSGILKFFDFAPLFTQLFDLAFERTPIITPTDPKLTKNEKELLYAFTKYPNAHNEKIQEVTRLSKPTIIKIKKKLFTQGYLRPIIAPNLKKLGLDQYSILRKDLPKPIYDLAPLREVADHDAHTFLSMIDDGQFLSFGVFKNQTALEENTLKKKNKYQDAFKTLESPEIYTYEAPKTVKLDFAPLVKVALNLDVDY